MTVGDLKRILRDRSDSDIVLVHGSSICSRDVTIRTPWSDDEIYANWNTEKLASADWLWLKEDK